LINAFRISKSRYAATAFSGEGARLSPGRFNSRGTALVYTSESYSLAVLETIANIEEHDELETLSTLYVSIRCSFDPTLVRELDRKVLPKNWDSCPCPPEVQKIGDDWVRSSASVVYRVPSVISPHEHNYLINPNHPDFPKIRIEKDEPLYLDPRFKKMLQIG